MTTSLRAFGAVVLRGRPGEEEVLVVHRQRYDDWSLPKGKPTPDEVPPVTAVRELREETGALVHLGMRLGDQHYLVSSRTPKRVGYWRATAYAQYFRPPDREVDEVRWVAARKVSRLLSYANEAAVVDEALAAGPTTAVLLTRHAKAMLRKHWTGPDQTRRLSGRGRRQAIALVPLFEAYGVESLISSPAVRCVETLAPYGKHRGLPTRTVELLTEEEGTDLPEAVASEVATIALGVSAPTALCGHRPVLPAMQRGLGLEPRPMVVGEVTVLHRDARGRNVAVEHVKPTS